MQDFVSPRICNQLGAIINPGSLYVITNIHVSPATEILRPVPFPNCIHFIHSKTVLLDPEDDFAIPMHKFECTPLGDLYERHMLYGADRPPLYSVGIHFFPSIPHFYLLVISNFLKKCCWSC